MKALYVWAFLIITAHLAPAGPTGLVITEIMYHPPEDPALEFIEIHNAGTVIHDISGFHIQGGVTFTLPGETYLSGGGYLVVAHDAEQIKTTYGITNVVGGFTGSLDNSGEQIRFCEPGRRPICEVAYSDRGEWPAAAAGTGHSLVLTSPFHDPLHARNWTWSPQLGGSPGGSNFPGEASEETVIVPADSQWRYKKGTAPPSDPPDAWYEPGFDDSTWSQGALGIGYGDNDDRTVLDDMRGEYFSVFVRNSFTVDGSVLSGGLSLKADYDDGFAAYLNGVEIARSCLGDPGDATPYNAEATSSHEARAPEYFQVLNYESLLRPGANVLACQVHNRILNSSDLSCIFSLVERPVPFPEAFEKQPLVINEIAAAAGGDGFIELCNNSLKPAALGDLMLVLGDESYTFPEGAALPAESLLALTAADLSFTFPAGEMRTFLKHEDGSVVDARIFTPRGYGTCEERYPDGSCRWATGITPTPGEPNERAVEEDVVINEIMYNPISGDRRLEYVELYNRSSRAIDLSGCSFVRGIFYTFPEGVSIPSQGYVVVARDSGFLRESCGLQDRLVTGDFDAALADRGERIRLVDTLDNVMDEVQYYDGGRWPEYADGLGASLELVDPWQDNNDPASWAAGDDSPESSWTHISYTGTCPVTPRESELHFLLMEQGECLIDNITIERASGGGNIVANGGLESTDMRWFRAIGTHGFSGRTTVDSASGSASYHLIATNRGNTRANAVELDTQQSLHAGTVYRVSFDAKWLGGCNVLHTKGLEFGLMHTEKLPLPQTPGTPGVRNSRWREQTGPVIGDVTQLPVVPDSGEAARIFARISDPDGVASAQLFYTTGRPGNFTAAAFSDDGRNGDRFAGDGLWTGPIPGFSRRTKVLFYIEAVDATDAASRFPKQAPDKTCLYQVDASVDSPLAVYRVSMNDANTAQLNSRPIHSNQLLDGTFVFDDREIYYNVGIRYRGSPYHRHRTPRMYRVSFNDDQLFHGMTTINITKYGHQQKERAAYYTMRLAGSPVSFSHYVRFYFNGVFDRTREHMQPINRDYLNMWFPDDSEGKLYKTATRLAYDDNGNHWGTRSCAFIYRGESAEEYRWNFQARTRECEDDYSELAALCRLMDRGETSNAQFDAEAEDLMDVDQWITVQGVRMLNDDWDTLGLRYAKNAYIYYAPGEGRWKLLPWDLDHTFGNPNATLLPGSDPGLLRLFLRPRYSRKYRRFLQDFTSGLYTAGHLSKVLDPTYSVLSREAGQSANPSGIKNFVASRAGFVRNFAGTGRSFSIDTEPFATDLEQVTIEGTAPVEVTDILVNAEPVPITWTRTTTWEADVALSPDVNELEFEGLDADGGLVGSDTVTVTCTLGWEAPVVTGLTPAKGSEEGGTSVRITGSGFKDGCMVYYGSVKAISVTVESEASVLTVTPPGKGSVMVSMTNIDNQACLAPGGFRYVSAGAHFIRGDVNSDGVVDISDAVSALDYLFAGGEPGCLKALDATDDGAVNIADPIAVLTFLFSRGEIAPPAVCGPDPTTDGIPCKTFPPCR